MQDLIILILFLFVFIHFAIAIAIYDRDKNTIRLEIIEKKIDNIMTKLGIPEEI